MPQTAMGMVESKEEGWSDRVSGQKKQANVASTVILPQTERKTSGLGMVEQSELGRIAR